MLPDDRIRKFRICLQEFYSNLFNFELFAGL